MTGTPDGKVVLLSGTGRSNRSPATNGLDPAGRLWLGRWRAGFGKVSEYAIADGGLDHSALHMPIKTLSA